MRSQAGFFLFLSFFLLLSLPNQKTFAKNPPIARKDIAGSLKSIFCGSYHTPDQLWKHGIFEGQIEGFTVEDLHSQPIRDEELWSRAQSIATVRHAGGYAAGVCESNRGFIATMPAPMAAQVNNGSLIIPTAKLDSDCKNWSIDYSPFQSGRSRQIGLKDLLKKWHQLEAGVISVTCQPSFPRWLGPKVWYFIPVKKDELLTQPIPEIQGDLSFSNLSQSRSEDVQNLLLTWIQKIRHREGLPPFQTNSVTMAAAASLGASMTIDHDRSLMNQVKKKFEGPTISFVGENRIQGSNIKDMIWMLWHSPKHRDLLLDNPQNKEIPLIGIGVTSASSEFLVTMVVAHGQSLDIAKNPKSEAKKIR